MSTPSKLAVFIFVATAHLAVLALALPRIDMTSETADASADSPAASDALAETAEPGRSSTPAPPAADNPAASRDRDARTQPVRVENHNPHESRTATPGNEQAPDSQPPADTGDQHVEDLHQLADADRPDPRGAEAFEVASEESGTASATGGDSPAHQSDPAEVAVVDADTDAPLMGLSPEEAAEVLDSPSALADLRFKDSTPASDFEVVSAAVPAPRKPAPAPSATPVKVSVPAQPSASPSATGNAGASRMKNLRPVGNDGR